MISFMFVMGLLPIIFAFLLLGIFAGRIAKRRSKNPWLWGGTTVLLLAVISWKQLSSWAAFTYHKGMVAMQTMKPKEPITTLAEARKINIHSSVDGVHFDVPLTYHFRGYDQKTKGWPSVSKGQIDGTERPAVDFINIVALLPDLAPMHEENLVEFEVLGWGKTVRASLTHIRSWDYYFKNFFNRTERRPDTPNAPGMLHYYDPLAKHDLYLNQSNPSPELTRITCNDQTFHKDESPSCKVETSYRPAPDIIASTHIEGAIFWLEYSYSNQYLTQWRDIDKRLKTLFDQFIRNASQHSTSHQ